MRRCSSGPICQCHTVQLCLHRLSGQLGRRHGGNLGLGRGVFACLRPSWLLQRRSHRRFGLVQQQRVRGGVCRLRPFLAQPRDRPDGVQFFQPRVGVAGAFRLPFGHGVVAGGRRCSCIFRSSSTQYVRHAHVAIWIRHRLRGRLEQRLFLRRSTQHVLLPHRTKCGLRRGSSSA